MSGADAGRRVRQQRLIADFGLFALREGDLPAILQRAAEIVVEGLECPLSKVLEHQPERQALLIRAGVGWRPGVIGQAMPDAEAASPAGYALHSAKPVLSNHVAEDRRFRTPALLLEHGVRRAMNVIIQDDGPPFGVLEADHTEGGAFSPDDTFFLQALANILAVALNRARLEEEREALRALAAREVHHRVKNSLQLVRSMLSLQAGTAEPAVRQALGQASARLDGIVAIHDLLYRGESLEQVQVADYLAQLVADLAGALGGGREVRLDGADPDLWPADDVPALGIVLTELVTNALKHGRGAVRVRFRRVEDGAELAVADDGPGFPAGFRPGKAKGLGMRLVVAMLGAQGGTIAVDAAAGGGRAVARFKRA